MGISTTEMDGAGAPRPEQRGGGVGPGTEPQSIAPPKPPPKPRTRAPRKPRAPPKSAKTAESAEGEGEMADETALSAEREQSDANLDGSGQGEHPPSPPSIIRSRREVKNLLGDVDHITIESDDNKVDNEGGATRRSSRVARKADNSKGTVAKTKGSKRGGGNVSNRRKKKVDTEGGDSASSEGVDILAEPDTPAKQLHPPSIPDSTEREDKTDKQLSLDKQEIRKGEVQNDDDSGPSKSSPVIPMGSLARHSGRVPSSIDSSRRAEAFDGPDIGRDLRDQSDDFWPDFRPESIHEIDESPVSSAEREVRNVHHSVSGRFSDSRRRSRSLPPEFDDRDPFVSGTRIQNKMGEDRVNAEEAVRTSGLAVGPRERHSIAPPRQIEESEELPQRIYQSYKEIEEGYGQNVGSARINYDRGVIRKAPHASVTASSNPSIERGRELGKASVPIRIGDQPPQRVTKEPRRLERGDTVQSEARANLDHRRIEARVGGQFEQGRETVQSQSAVDAQRPDRGIRDDPRRGSSNRGRHSHRYEYQCLRDFSSLEEHKSFRTRRVSSVLGRCEDNSIEDRQFSLLLLPKQARRDEVVDDAKDCGKDLGLAEEKKDSPNSRIRTGSREHVSRRRLSYSGISRYERLEVEPNVLRDSESHVGSVDHRPILLGDKLPATALLHVHPRRGSSSYERVFDSLVGGESVGEPSVVIDQSNPQQNAERGSRVSALCTGLDGTELVPNSITLTSGLPDTSSTFGQLVPAPIDFEHEWNRTTELGSDSPMAIIRQSLEHKGIPRQVIEVVVQHGWREKTKLWLFPKCREYKLWCEGRHIDPFSPNHAVALQYLNELREKGMSIAVLEKHRSAISCLWYGQSSENNLGDVPIVRKYFKGLREKDQSEKAVEKEKEVKILNHHELRRHITSVNPTNIANLRTLGAKLAVLLIILTKARPADLVKIIRESILLDNVVKFTISLPKETSRSKSKIRSVQIEPPHANETKKWIDAYLQRTKESKCPFLFVKSDKIDEVIRSNTINSWCRTVFDEVGWSDVRATPYTLIKSVTTNELRRGKNIKRVVGTRWKKDQTCLKYYDLRGSAKNAIAQKVSSIQA